MDPESMKPAEGPEKKAEGSERKVVFVERPSDGRGVMMGTDHMHMMVKLPPKPPSDPE